MNLLGGNSANAVGLIGNSPASIANRNQYYSLNLGTIQVKDTRQSCYRYWNRLHRFQKTLIILIIAIFIIFVVTHFHYHPTNEAVNYEHKHEPTLEAINKPAELPPPPPQQAHLPIDPQKNEAALAAELVEKLKQTKRDQERIIVKGPQNEMQHRVVNAFKHAWKGYKEYAWGEDELKPISKTKTSWFNLGLTIVDSLDTIILMNLDEEYSEAREWIDTKLNLDSDRYNNLFELTIRIVGGLLSAYHLKMDELFLKKAYDCANRTLTAFATPSEIPLSDVNLARRNAKSPYWTSDSSISEVATLQLEFKDLTYVTRDGHFSEVVKRVSRKIHALNKLDGLVPIFISTNHGRFVGSTITLGARGDSYYEYLLKQWIQLGPANQDENNEEQYLLDDWIDAYNGIKKRLLRHSKPNNLTFVGESISDQFSPKMDHLVCFLPGNLALASIHLKNHKKYGHMTDELLQVAEQLTETCYKLYSTTATGLSPEIAYFNIDDNAGQDIIIKDADRHNLLRPETIESLYYLYKITKNKKYQQYGVEIFNSFEKYTKVETGGYTSISDVMTKDNVRPRDKMESFFLAETLKYFYLLFESDDSNEVDLYKWIFNTEAHLMPVFK